MDQGKVNDAKAVISKAYSESQAALLKSLPNQLKEHVISTFEKMKAETDEAMGALLGEPDSGSSSNGSRALPGLYSQYDKAGKHWYAPNKFEAYGEEEIAAVTECLRDGFLAPGPKTEQFEAIVSSNFSKQMGLMVNSGSSANLIALNAFGFKPGDEVVTAACTFSTVIAPLVQLGVKPIFVDVDATTYVPRTDDIINAITSKTVSVTRQPAASRTLSSARGRRVHGRVARTCSR